jgi:trk system potassium uptake protein TrkH
MMRYVQDITRAQPCKAAASALGAARFSKLYKNPQKGYNTPCIDAQYRCRSGFFLTRPILTGEAGIRRMQLHARHSERRESFFQRTIRPERMMALGFLGVILVGTFLLALPISAVGRRSIGIHNALFTATSAVCVTGLVVVDTGTTFTLFGKLIILLLLQIGGLGFMIFATLVMVALGRRISLRNRVLIRESMNTTSLSGLVRLSKWFSLLTIMIELAGALILSIRFIPMYGVRRGILYSVFHAVSAFCNAGFDLFGNYASLSSFKHDPLLVTGTLLVLALEWDNPATLGDASLSVGERLMNALFQSTTLRTAGFSTLDQAKLTDSTKLIDVIFMFIGASPASTGGGVKTTTISVLFLLIVSVIRGQDSVGIFGKQLPNNTVKRALAIVFISLGMVIVCTCALSISERVHGKDMLDLVFEATSAFATVGLSAAGTPTLTSFSQALLIPLMFFGRVGPLTIAFALASRLDNNPKNRIRFPEEKIMIG